MAKKDRKIGKREYRLIESCLTKEQSQEKKETFDSDLKKNMIRSKILKTKYGYNYYIPKSLYR